MSSSASLALDQQLDGEVAADGGGHPHQLTGRLGQLGQPGLDDGLHLGTGRARPPAQPARTASTTNSGLPSVSRQSRSVGRRRERRSGQPLGQRCGLLTGQPAELDHRQPVERLHAADQLGQRRGGRRPPPAGPSPRPAAGHRRRPARGNAGAATFPGRTIARPRRSAAAAGQSGAPHRQRPRTAACRWSIVRHRLGPGETGHLSDELRQEPGQLGQLVGLEPHRRRRAAPPTATTSRPDRRRARPPRRTTGPRRRLRPAGHTTAEVLDEPGLPDTGLTGHEHQRVPDPSPRPATRR